MRAWIVDRPGPVTGGPLRLVDRDVPEPGPGEVRVRIAVCGVCRTDLHLAEGDLPPRRPGVVPGHEIVGRVDAVGAGAERFAIGDRAGIAWLRHTDGRCRFCLRGDENLCVSPGFTGWDADGGYAEAAVVDERYAYRLPERFSDEEAAPLLCAGIIGYRALERARLPPGGRLGIYGFGASAHLTAQIAEAQGAAVYVVTRGAAGAASGPRARRRVGRRARRRSSGAARRGHPLRPGRRPRSSCARCPRPGCHPGHRRHPPHRRARPLVRAPPVRGAVGDQRDGQHPGRWGGAAPTGRPHPTPCRDRAVPARTGRRGARRPGR